MRAAVIAVLVAVAALGAWLLVSRPPPRGKAVQPPTPVPPLPVPVPPLRSWYGEAVGDVLDLDRADVVRLERRLETNPHDLAARAKLMAYHQRGDRAARPQDLARRVEHALWLIEHYPNHELLHSPLARFAPAELAAAGRLRAAALWEAAVRARPGDAAVRWNAASFYEGLDPELHLHYLEETAAADPNHPFALRPLAHLYATLILGGGPLARRAEAGLDRSRNVWVLGNAAHMFQSLYNQSRQAGASHPRGASLAERTFLRAQALNPALDRKAILPQIDLKAIERARQAEAEARERWPARAREALARIRRLPVEAFGDLPPAVAAALGARHCTVPQPEESPGARNVVRGEFFARGEPGWAVLCSVGDVTRLLVFRHDRDTDPEVVTSSEDERYLQGLGGDRIGYSRQISAVGRDFILRHWRAYGGPEPPPIDHHAIDDAFLEKGSITWYRYQGRWLQLQGAD